MEPINGWNEIKEAGSFEKVELGGHICVIVNAKNELSRNGNQMLKIAFDFASEDKQAGYYKRMFDEDQKRGNDAKWRGVYIQGHHTEQSNQYFKGFINRILESNPGYMWSWDEKSLIGKKFCGVFGREEYPGDNGKTKFATKCMFVHAVSDIDKVTVPEDKLLVGKATTQVSTSNSFTPLQAYNGNLQIDDDELPF